MGSSKSQPYEVSVNAARQFGIVRSGLGDTTEAKLDRNQARMRRALSNYPRLMHLPWQWESAQKLEHTGFERYNFKDTIIIPQGMGGRTWRGQGRGTSQGAGNLYTPTFQMRSEWDYVTTTFDGTTNLRLRNTTAGASNKILVVGRPVNAETDLYSSIFVTGGTNAIFSGSGTWYGIEEVDEEENTWTLDRNWATGTVTNGAGLYRPTLIRDFGKGNEFESLRFFGTRDESGESAYVKKGLCAYHGWGNPTSTTANTSKTVFDKCMFDGWEFAVIQGRHLAQYGQFTGTNASDGSAFAGSGDNNADHLDFRGCWFSNNKTCLVVRNTQSVGHTFSEPYVEECETFLDVECGGKIYVTKLHLQGPNEGFPHRIIKIGRAINESTFDFSFRDISTDATCYNPQLAVSDWSTVVSGGQLLFDLVKIQRRNSSTLPLFDLHGGIFLKLYNASTGDIGNKGRIMRGDFLFRDGGSARKVHGIIRDSYIGEDLADIPKLEKVDTGGNPTSTGGHILDFYGCKLYNGDSFTNKRLTFNAAGTGAITDI